jgi:hypothetical protein
MDTTNETWPDAASTSIYADKRGNAPISDTEGGADRVMTPEKMIDDKEDFGPDSDYARAYYAKYPNAKRPQANEAASGKVSAEFDYVTDDDGEQFVKNSAKRLGLTFKTVSQEGPGGGWPVGKVSGPKDAVKKFLIKHYGDKETAADAHGDIFESVISEEEINEVLKKSQPASEWIADFINSDNPKFKGKSKGERINMALGAYYAAQRNESVSEGVEEPRSQGEKNFKAAHTIVKMADPNADRQTGTEAMDQKAKPVLPIGKTFSKADDIDGEKYIDKDVANIKSSATRATAPKATGAAKLTYANGCEVYDKTASSIKKSAQGAAAAPKASGSKQSGAQSIEKVSNTAPNGKLSAEYPKANQKRPDAMPKGLKETALANLLGEEKMSNFDKQFADDNEKALKQILAGQGTDGIECHGQPKQKVLVQLNKYIDSYGDELKKYFGIPIQEKEVNEAASKMSPEQIDDKVSAIFKRFGIQDTNYEQDLDKAIEDLSKKSRIAAAQVKSLLKDSVNEVIDSASDRDDTGEYKGGSKQPYTPEYLGTGEEKALNRTGATRASDWADACEDAAKRVAGLVNRDKDTPLQYRLTSKLKAAYSMLADVAEKLDNDTDEATEVNEDPTRAEIGAMQRAALADKQRAAMAAPITRAALAKRYGLPANSKYADPEDHVSTGYDDSDLVPNPDFDAEKGEEAGNRPYMYGRKSDYVMDDVADEAEKMVGKKTFRQIFDSGTWAYRVNMAMKAGIKDPKKIAALIVQEMTSAPGKRPKNLPWKTDRLN